MKKGFTLIELMGVLVIIGLLSLIIIPVTTNIIKEQKEETYNMQIKSLILAAKNYGSDNLFYLPQTEDEYIYVTIKELRKGGYLDATTISSSSNQPLSECARIKITRKGQTYEYEYDYSSETELNC